MCPPSNILRFLGWVFVLPLFFSGGIQAQTISGCEETVIHYPDSILSHYVLDCPDRYLSCKYSYSGRLQSEYEETYSYTSKNYRLTSTSWFYEYYPNGQVKEKYFEHYRPGKSQADSLLRYDTTGTLREKTVYHTRDSIAFTWFYASGKVKSVYRFHKKRLMEARHYSTQGTRLTTGSFQNGKGLLNQYDNDNRVAAECYYKNGKPVKRKCKNAAGCPTGRYIRR